MDKVLKVRQKKMKTRTQKIVIAAMIASLTCVATMIIKVPMPYGYANLGDCIVLLGGWVLSPLYGFMAAGIGSALADILSGYALYAPVTFVIKGVMALVAYYGVKCFGKKISSFTAQLISGTIAELIMAAGYYIYEGFLYGFATASVSIGPNLAQGAVGLIAGLMLVKVFEKNKIML